MRPSKKQKEIIQDHQNIRISKTELAELRKSRRLKNNKGIRLIQFDEKLVNRKKNPKLRRKRNPLRGFYVPVLSNNKYNPDGSLKHAV